jgi:hypothetical protein
MNSLILTPFQLDVREYGRGVSDVLGVACWSNGSLGSSTRSQLLIVVRFAIEDDFS